MPQRPTRREIAEQDRYMLARLAAFRRAADAAVTAFATFPEVRAIMLFGSVARPLRREVQRFQRFRRFGIELLHECKDVDLAVLIDDLDNLSALNRARNKTVADVHKAGGLGVAHHQMDVFLFDDGWNNYLGRLCTYGQCPKGKVECLAPGCGRKPFLKQHREFVFRCDALAADRIVPLYERGRGVLCRASDLDDTAHISPEPGRPAKASRQRS
jgi:hypothetical protein